MLILNRSINITVNKLLKTTNAKGKKLFSSIPNNMGTYFPFNFKGYPYTNPNNYDDATVNKSLQSLLKDESTKQGIFMAYNNYIDALIEKDVNFLSDICERGMGNSVEER